MTRQAVGQADARGGGARRRAALAVALLMLVLVTGGAALASGGIKVSGPGYGYGYGYGGAPAVTTGAASSVTATFATLNATVNPEGQPLTGCYFEYGTTKSLGHRSLCESLPGPVDVAVAVTAMIGGVGTGHHVSLRDRGEQR